MISVASANSHIDKANEFVTAIETNILFPLMSLLFSVAFLFFMWGMFEYVKNAENEEARANGRKHILYGLIGMLVMISALAILKIAANTVGVTIPT